LDKGILFTFWALLTQPTESLRNYLKGATKKYYAPIPYFLTAMTILLLMGGLHKFLEAEGWSSGKMFVFDETSGKMELQKYYNQEKAEYISKIKLADSVLFPFWNEKNKIHEIHILKDGDNVMDEEFNYPQTIKKLLEIENEEKKAYNELEVKVLRSNLLIYTTYYLTPLLLSMIVFVFYFQKKYNFTEHLIVQTYITAQIVWYLNIVLALFYGSQYLIQTSLSNFSFAKLPLPIIVSSVGVFGLLLFAYYFQVSRKFYQQSAFLVLLKTIFILPILLIISSITFILGVYFLVGKGGL
jgi:hypothetical protein